MADQILQKIMIEFSALVTKEFEKTFKNVANGFKALSAAQKEAGASASGILDAQDKMSQSSKRVGTETEKTTETKKKFAKVMRDLQADYSKSGAGLQSVVSAMRYFTLGVTKGNETIEVARKKTRDYISSLTSTNSVLMNTNKAWGSWAKSVSFNSLKLAENQGYIQMTRDGIRLLNADAHKSIGLTRDQANALKAAGLSNDLYAKTLKDGAQHGERYQEVIRKMGNQWGKSTERVAYWSTALENSRKATGAFGIDLRNLGSGLVQIATNLNLSSVAASVMRGNIAASASGFKVFNEAGLKTLGITVEQAAQMKMLGSSYNEYGKTLQKLTHHQKQNLDTFHHLTGHYGKHDAVVKDIGKSLTAVDKVISSKVVNNWAKLRAEVDQGTLKMKDARKAQNEFVRSFDRTTMATEHFEAAQRKAVGGHVDFTREMAAATKKSKEYQEAFYQLGRLNKDMPGQWKSTQNALNAVERAIQKTAGAMTKAGSDGEKWARSQDRMRMTNQMLSGELQIVNGLLTGWEKNLESGVGKVNRFQGAITRLTNAFKSMAAYSLSAFAFFGVIGILNNIGQQITLYDQSLKDLQAITTATDYETKRFGETIKYVASQTRFSAQEVAIGMKYFGQAGFTAAETMAIIHDAATLATGTLSNFDVVADLLSTTIRAFQLEATEGARLADIFANAINRSKLDVDKLRVAFNYFAPVAHKANLTVEESVSMMGLLANAGVRASTIGTGLRQVLEKITNPTEKFRKAIERAGFTLDDFVINDANPLEDVIRRLARVIPDAQTSFELFGMRGSSAVSALTNAGVDGFLRMKNSVVESGSALKMAEKQMEGLGNKSKNMRDKLELVGVALGEAGLKYALEGVIDLVRGLADFLAGVFNNVIGATIISVTALAAALAAGKVILEWYNATKFATAFAGIISGATGATASVTGLTFSLAGLKAALASVSTFLLTSPLGWAILATGITFAAGAMYKYSREVEDHITLLDKKKQRLDQEERDLTRQRRAMESLLYIAKDSANSDAERTRAIDRLSAMGIKFNGVLRDQDGIITNLNEVLNKNNHLLEEKFQLIDKFVAGKNVERLQETLATLSEVESAIAEFERGFHQKGINPYAEISAEQAAQLDPFYRKDIENHRKYIEDKEQLEQDSLDQIKKFKSKNEEQFKQELINLNIRGDKLNELMAEWTGNKGVTVNILKELVTAVAEQKHAGKDAAEIAEEVAKSVDMLMTVVANRAQSFEGALKDANESIGTSVLELYNSLPDLDDVLSVKDLDFYLDSLRRVSTEGENIIKDSYGKAIVAIKGTSENLSDEQQKTVEKLRESQSKALENLNRETYELKQKAMQGAFRLMELETQRQIYEYDSQIIALKTKHATGLILEAEYQASLLKLQAKQNELEKALVKEKLEMMQEYAADNLAEQKQLENQLVSLGNRMAELRVPKTPAKQAKKSADDALRREEERRAHEHAVRINEIQIELFGKEELLARTLLEEKKKFNEQEIEIITNLYNLRMSQGKDIADQKRSLNRLKIESLRLQQEELALAEKEQKLKEAHAKEARDIAFKRARIELRDIKHTNIRKIEEEKLRHKIELSLLEDRLRDQQISEENYLAEKERLYAEHYQNMEDLEDDWRKSATKAMEQYMEESGTYAEGFQKTFGNAFKNLEDAFVEFARTGKLSFRDLINTMLSDLARLSTNQMFKSIFGYILGDPYMGGGGGDLMGGGGGGGLFGAIARFFTGGMSPVAASLLKTSPTIGGGAIALASGMTAGAPAASLAAAEALSKATGTLSGTTSAIASESTGFFSGLWAKITGFFSNFTNMFSGEGGFFSNFFGGLWEKVKGFFGFFTGLFTGEGGFIGNFFGNIWEKITGLFGGLTGGFGGMFETLKGGMTGFFGGFGSTIAGWFGSLAQGFTGFFGTIWSWIQGLFAGGLGGIGSSIGGGLMTLFRPVLGLFGMADGGPVPGYSPHSRADNIPILATAGEFMHPVPTVDYYGRGVMEAIRTKSIPRDVLSNYAKQPKNRYGNKFADGGVVDNYGQSHDSANTENPLQIVNILDPGMFDQYVSSQAGQKAILNVISRNPAIIKNMMR